MTGDKTFATLGLSFSNFHTLIFVSSLERDESPKKQNKTQREGAQTRVTAKR